MSCRFQSNPYLQCYHQMGGLTIDPVLFYKSNLGFRDWLDQKISNADQFEFAVPSERQLELYNQYIKEGPLDPRVTVAFAKEQAPSWRPFYSNEYIEREYHDEDSGFSQYLRAQGINYINFRDMSLDDRTSLYNSFQQVMMNRNLIDIDKKKAASRKRFSGLGMEEQVKLLREDLERINKNFISKLEQIEKLIRAIPLTQPTFQPRGT